MSTAPPISAEGKKDHGVLQPEPERCQAPTGTEPSNQTASPGHDWIVSFFWKGTTTPSLYVPARRTIVPPDFALATAAVAVRSGAALVPAAESEPDGATTMAPDGTA
ncbi:hypothetical protein [Frigoribacterium sp. SL97]|uniref:hypothetical protein n=1 Tax=Frigoribacterium sp. SL97 TaxID=2994664 RepID=UPI00226E8820|nr:hypothetical protein [Frigoribacterium sp. SL97]WAC52429.1 hypothetical protein OVA02_03925 [Frigoribacterium sp. SL97]